MCCDADSTPPVPAIAGAAVAHEKLVLEGADANKLRAFEAVPDDGASVGIVILPDNRGLSRFYEELALRFAERGYAAIAIDYYGRTAGVEDRGEDFPAAEHMHRTTVAQVQSDVAAAVTRLRSSRGVESAFTVGCCFGASMSWIASASGHGLAGAVGFHGGVGERGGEPGPTERAGAMEAPILALQGGADPHISAEDNADFDAALTAAGIEHQVVIEPGAPHSYFDRLHDEYAEQSEDAWQRTLEFIEQHS